MRLLVGLMKKGLGYLKVRLHLIPNLMRSWFFWITLFVAFGLPLVRFLWEVLEAFQVQLYHLTPKS